MCEHVRSFYVAHVPETEVFVFLLKCRARALMHSVRASHLLSLGRFKLIIYPLVASRVLRHANLSKDLPLTLCMCYVNVKFMSDKYKIISNNFKHSTTGRRCDVWRFASRPAGLLHPLLRHRLSCLISQDTFDKLIVCSYLSPPFFSA